MSAAKNTTASVNGTDAVEQASRFNSRKIDDGNRFELVLSGVVGKRLTYRRLCAIGDAGFMGIE